MHAFFSISKMKEVERIIRVNHAGELGAINIYKAQLSVSRLLYGDMVSMLSDMLAHEIGHFETFDRLLKARGVRPCYVLPLWGLGGFMLGLCTATLGRKSIWVCTNAIESTVLEHLEWQLEYLKNRDIEAYEAVLSIKADEEEHQMIGEKHSEKSLVRVPVHFIVEKSTKFAIWLSTKL